MTALELLGAIVVGFLAGLTVRLAWHAEDDPIRRAEAVARVRLLDRQRECPAADQRIAERIRLGTRGGSGGPTLRFYRPQGGVSGPRYDTGPDAAWRPRRGDLGENEVGGDRDGDR